MGVYSTNQNRLLYVALNVKDAAPSTLGDVQVKSDVDGHKFIIQKGLGGIVSSDIINPDSIMWANASAPKDTEIKLKAVTLRVSNFNSGNLISGEDYILRINFRQMYGMSDEDIYQKYGAVHATASMTKPEFYKKMIYSLIKNFSRLYSPMLEIGVNNKSNIVAKATKDNDGTVRLYKDDGSEILTSPTAIYIAEKSQVDEWALGTKPYVPVYFEVIPTTVTDINGEEGVWGTVEEVTDDANLPTPVKNGYKYADLEWFCMGERADQYRNVGWPNSIQTKYMVDPETEYYCLDIHYAYQGTCEDIQKSEKTLTILSTKKAYIDSLITGFGITSKVKKTTKYTTASDPVSNP